MRSLAVIAALGVLAGCTPTPEEQAVIDRAADLVAESSTDARQETGTYAPYRDGVIGTGRPVVLFFHASWCPKCAIEDARIAAWYAEGGLPISIYKVDYDTATSLKQEYGVVTQHTFVLVDGDGGAQATVSGPSEAELMKLLGG